jgi:hypothetical protein
MGTLPAIRSGTVRLLAVPAELSAASTSLTNLLTDLEHDQPAEAVRYKQQRAEWNSLINSASILPLPNLVLTFLFRFKALNNRSATVDALCCIGSLPNHWDWYPYRMMRAFGATVGSIVSSSSQLIHRGFSLVPAFLHQLSSGWAPRPWIATMLGRSAYAVKVST